MPVGSKRQIFVPPDPSLEGDRPRGRKRSASTVRLSLPLVVEVELLAVKRAPSAGERIAAATSPAVSAKD
jgi:hypothetical protein